MALARLSVGTGSKGKASPHAQYIAREGKYAKPSSHQEKLEHTGHGNMPAWAEHNPNYFWQCADEYERKNGSTYREHVIALPRELDSEQRHDLIKDWIEKEIGDKHAYQYAIHNPPAMDGKEQPHAHIMFSERTRDGIERDPDQYFKRYNSKHPERGGAKKANTGMKPADRKAELKDQRNRWEQTCNKHLEQAGRKERINMKSLKEQGFTRKPINLSMSQLKDPKIKGAYQIILDSKRDYIALRQQTRQEINPRKELAEQARQAKQEQARPEQPEVTKAPPAPEPPQTPTKQDIENKRNILARFSEEIKSKAEEIHKHELKEIREKAKPLLDKINELKDNKPLNPFKVKAWQEDIDKRVEHYNGIKANHDKEKETGITERHKDIARALYYKAFPESYDKLVQYQSEVNSYDNQQAELERQQRQAELEQRRQEREAQRAERGNDRGMDR